MSCIIKDFNENGELRKKAHEALNKLRSDANLSVLEAWIKVARELGYKVSEDDAKKFITRMQYGNNAGKTQLSDDELEHVAGGGLCGWSCYPHPVEICDW